MRKYFPPIHPSLRLLLVAALLGVLAFAIAHGAQANTLSAGASQDGLWNEVKETSIRAQGERRITPLQYRTLSLDADALHALLAQAPLEFSAEAQTNLTEISLPLPDGGYGRFRFVESPVMEPGLAAKYPEIKTYLGSGIDDPQARLRFDWTPHGFHAMILSDGDTVFVDPYLWGDTQTYVSYFKSAYPSMHQGFVKYEPLGNPHALDDLVQQVREQKITVGEQLRTYRTAIAATGEYTQFHGGTVPLALAEIVTALNRVTGVYERDVAVRMVLVATNNLIIYTNGATDPYTNDDGFAMLDENQANLDAVIGDANYDIGHVFSTGGGGVAALGAPCVSGTKAQGVTGSPSPVGDPFYIDYVAHEMGHQFGANHTFNSVTGSCGGSNRNASTAYEPGSASTIMGYAGICGADDLQPNSDDDFHSASFDEMIAYTQLGQGNTCAVVTNTGNLPPVVDAGVGGFTIPKNTPFKLTGSATDPDGDPLTYDWEEFDLGPAGSPNSPSGNAPIFRSFVAVSTPERVFPKMTDIVNNTQTIGELLPSYARSLTFRLMVRDNHVSPSAGGVSYDTIAFSVSGTAGPFLVTAPNTPVSWEAATPQTVTWDVAGTDAAPVSCTGVDILLSRDGGYTYPVTLVTNAPNDGSENVEVPNEPANLVTTARIKVACANNIFFDISNTNFTITAPTSPNPKIDLNGSGSGIDYAASFSEDGGAIAIVDGANLTVNDLDSAELDKAVVTITNLQDGTDEALSATPSGGISAGDISYDTAAGALTIDPPGTAPLADFEAVLRTVTYDNASQDPGSSSRLVNFLADDGTNSSDPLALSTVTVLSINDAPSFTKGADLVIPENAGPQTFAGWATDITAGPGAEAGQTLNFVVDTDNPALFAAAPALDALSGNLTFTAADGITGTTVVTAALQDSGGTANGGVNTFFDTFVISITQANIAPVLASIADQNVDEGSLITLTVSASDPEQPGQSLSYALDNAPSGAAINAASGLFTWTPGEADGPGVYTATVTVSDDAPSPLSDSQIFAITVSEVNQAPVLASVGPQTVIQGELLTVNVSATDGDLPANTLTFALGAGAPAGAAIDAATGVFTWTPTTAQAPGDYTITILVSDGGSPELSDSITFTVTVDSAARLVYLPLITR